MTGASAGPGGPAGGRGMVITGLPRAGTSWAGRMLQAGGGVVYVNEPLNPQRPPGRSPGVLNAEVTHRFQYICADNDDRWARAFGDTLRLRYHPVAELRRNHGPGDLARMAKYWPAFTAGRLRGRRPLIDDPFAVLSSAWFAERLGCRVVALVRHPVGFVGSWHKLGWRIDFNDLLGQPLLMRDLLAPYEDEMRALMRSDDRLASISLLWRMTHSVLHEQAARLPLLHLVRYEDLASDPVESFAGLYDLFGLTWSERVRQAVMAGSTGSGTPEKAHAFSLRSLSRTGFRPMDSKAAITSYQDRLTQEQIERVSELTADVAKLFYDDNLPAAKRPGTG